MDRTEPAHASVVTRSAGRDSSTGGRSAASCQGRWRIMVRPAAALAQGLGQAEAELALAHNTLLAVALMAHAIFTVGPLIRK